MAGVLRAAGTGTIARTEAGHASHLGGIAIATVHTGPGSGDMGGVGHRTWLPGRLMTGVGRCRGS